MSKSNFVFEEILVSPYTLEPVVFETDKFVTKDGADQFPVVNGRVDFRLKRPKNYSVNFVLGKDFETKDINFKPIGMNPEADVDYSKISIPHHLGPEILSYFPKAKSADSYVLDLGCGTGLHKQVCEMAGYKYIGMDYVSKEATLLADGHALPFKDNSIDLVISISVMEHVQFPWIMAQEVARVLKPGGRFIATLSFLEPFHDASSYYHMSHWGVLNTLRVGGFTKIKLISPNKGWEGIDAVSIMHYFSSLPWWAIKAITFPYKLLHKLWWKFAELTRRRHYHVFNSEYRLLASSGSFIFIVEK